MNVYTSRSSVAAGDDVDAPHARTHSFPDATPLKEVLAEIIRCGYLPTIAGGCATWSVTSNRPVAVVAQQWPEQKMFVHLPEELRELDIQNGVLRLHFNYHAQLDPQVGHSVLWGFRLNAT